jgi:hypothetical protein
MWTRFSIYTLLFLLTVSCHNRQETVLSSQLRISIDEVKIPIPNDMPNDWIGIAASFENGERVLHQYDQYHKSIIQFSLDRKQIIKRIYPFSDTLDPGNNPIYIHRIEKGYFLSGGAKLGFMLINNDGNLKILWNDYYPNTRLIKNWDYNFKYRPRSSASTSLSMLDKHTIPIYIELSNMSYDAVYRDDFYDYDIFGKLNLHTGVLERFPVRFPENFNRNGLSYPMRYIPSFTSMADGKIAYFFGIDDTIHVLDTNTGEISDFSIPNPSFPLNIRPIDQASFMDRNWYVEFTSNLSYYSGLYYDPYRKGLVRMGLKKENRRLIRIYELLDENMNIVGQFEQSSQYSPTPFFLPNEIWFPFQMGYAEDEMKLLRVRIEE